MSRIKNDEFDMYLFFLQIRLSCENLWLNFFVKHLSAP